MQTLGRPATASPAPRATTRPARFANFELFDISGTKFTDINGDGLTAGDVGLDGVTIFIDVDGDTMLTGADKAPHDRQRTAPGRSSNLDTSYAGLDVYEVLPRGYVQTLGQAGYSITGTSGTRPDRPRFANFELFDISGTKYTDTTATA